MSICAEQSAATRFLGFNLSYSLPTIEIDIKNQELALRREAPQRLIFHWEGSNTSGDSYKSSNLFNKPPKTYANPDRDY